MRRTQGRDEINFDDELLRGPGRLPVDALGVVMLLRNALQAVPGLSDDDRALLLRLVEIAMSDLHPRPLPVWLLDYQVMSEARRRQVDDFVARQAKVEKAERRRTH